MRNFSGVLIGMVLAALLLSTAAQATPFGPVQEQLVAEGMVSWDATSIPGCPNGFVGEMAPFGTLPEEAPFGPTIGWTYGDECRMVIVEGLEPCVEREIIYHELGHLLGLPHSSDPSSIMYPQMQRRFCLPPAQTHVAAAYKHRKFQHNKGLGQRARR